MEPYRPFADEVAMEVIDENPMIEALTTKEKMKLLRLLQIDVRIGDKKRPLMIALSETTATLARCFAGEEVKIEYPVFEQR
jgi:CRISPR-associated protein Cas1